MSSFSGYMLASQIGSDFTVSQVEHPTPELKGGPRLEYREQAFGLSRWGAYSLFSPIPLEDEPEGQRDPYIYNIYVVRGLSKLIVIAPRRKIVDYTLSQVFDRRIFPVLRKINVYLDKLIAYSSSVEAEFLVTSLHGKFSGQSRDVKSISLYGDDVTSSRIFIDYKEFFNFHSCGVGRRLFKGLPRIRQNEEGEIVRVSNDGFITLNLSGRRQAKELIRVVDMIVQNRWVDDWVISRNESYD